MLNKSHIYVAPNDWILKGLSDQDKLTQEYELAKWYSKESMEARHNLVFEKIYKFCNKSNLVVIDYGCGGGAFLSKISKNMPCSTLFGLDISTELLDIAKKRKISNAEFYNYRVSANLPGTLKNFLEVSPKKNIKIATLIGVLQNCGSDPKELLKSIKGHYPYEFFFITTKVSFKENKDFKKLKHSVFLIPELFELFNNLKMSVQYFAPLYSKFLSKPDESNNFNALFVLRNNCK